jgi:regulator of sigma E protease
MIPFLVYAVVNVTHAGGHVLAARLFKLRLERISLGLGPTIWQRTWRGTMIRLTPFPVGLFVRLRPRWVKGEDAPAVERGDFNSAGALARLAIICAPLLLLLLLSWGAAFYLHGVGVLHTGSAVVGDVVPRGPAAVAGLLPGDVITSINGARVAAWKDLLQEIPASKGRPLQLVLRRGGQELRLEVTPRRAGDRWVIGISAGTEIVRLRGTAERAGAAVGTVLDTMRRWAAGVWSILAGGSYETIGGPIQVVAWVDVENAEVLASRQAHGVMVSIVNYLIICLLPIPFLDGRRLIFWLLGLAARGRLHPRWEQRFNRWGFAVVGLLLVLVTAGDVLRRFS